MSKVTSRRSIHDPLKTSTNEEISLDEATLANFSDDDDIELMNRQTQCESKKQLSPESTKTTGVNTHKAFKKTPIKGSENFSYIFLIPCGLLLYAAVRCLANFTEKTNVPEITISDLKAQFPSQSLELWTAIESGIEDTITFNQPSVFILLYKRKDRKTVKLLLEKISSYASYRLNEGDDSKAISVYGQDLNTEESIKDYGNVIEEYRSGLQEKHIMIVEDLDLVSPQVIQAFHSLCDQFHPTVAKSIFIFTLAVNDFNRPLQDDFGIVEHILTLKWTSLPSNIVEPLFSRLTNVILRVVPEMY